MCEWSVEDRRHMARAIQLAEKGLYSTHPNPRVGCVIVREGQVVGEGWHVRAGEGHAEVNALDQAGELARGATAYVTLEPCSHFGRTPPCAQALVAAGVSRVVAAMQDPNPMVAGNGLKQLQEAGVEVSAGLLEHQAIQLNQGFIKRMSKGRPFVRLKMAVSIDGRTAMSSGESKWITGEEARADVHKMRGSSSAILSTADTVSQDNARLNVRLDSAIFPDGNIPSPLRVVLDRDAMLDGEEALFEEPGDILYVYDAKREMPEKIALKNQALGIPLELNDEGYFNLPELLEKLCVYQINELMVEAGPGMAGQFIEQGLVDELVIYMAPKLMGSLAKPMAELKIEKMSEARELKLQDVRMVGDDLRLTYRFD
jgi:diaminohydroxyphosphoribosylaminopyrimidine deaminase/5-amino-6-(5-phosphoribosylamino)uracil reductase